MRLVAHGSLKLAETETILRGLAAIIVLGVCAQWLAWRLALPSILLLLVFGFVAGTSVSEFLDTDALLGNLLFPIVSISVALILYEGEHRRRIQSPKR